MFGWYGMLKNDYLIVLLGYSFLSRFCVKDYLHFYVTVFEVTLFSFFTGEFVKKKVDF